jgi:hypothetical protein
MRVMQLGGGLTALSLGALLATLWYRERRRKDRAPDLSAAESVH